MAFAVQVPTVCERPRSRLLRIALYWHLLSLDAPTVAVLWAWSFEHAAGVHTSASAIAVLGLGTWLIYVADRLLDARPLRTRSQARLRERHFFHARHCRTLLALAWPVVVALLWLIVRMPSADRRDDALLFAVAILYFGSVHLAAPRARRGFAREVMVGVVFALATAIPAWSQTQESRAQMALLVVLFAALCCLNTIAIEVWEQPENARRFSVSMTAGLLALCAATLGLSPEMRDAAGSLMLCAGLSAMALFCLDALHRRRSSSNPAPDDSTRWLLLVRVAADAALLTPLLLVVPWR